MAIKQFQETIRAAGLQPPDSLQPDKLYRFPGAGKKPGNKAARCFLFDDLRGGWYMDYSTGLFGVWQTKRDKPYTDAERHAFRQQCERDRLAREQDKIKTHAAAADKATSIWASAPLADDSNGYCARMRIQPYGARLYNGVLVIPICDESLQLVNLQFIHADGTKRFLKGSRKKACFSAIGKATDTILICEGYATGASLHEATGHFVVVAMDAGNLEPVARVIRRLYPESEIIICGDNDINGVGQTAARAAALAIGGKYLLPPKIGTDWNDVLTAEAEALV